MHSLVATTLNTYDWMSAYSPGRRPAGRLAQSPRPVHYRGKWFWFSMAIIAHERETQNWDEIDHLANISTKKHTRSTPLVEGSCTRAPDPQWWYLQQVNFHLCLQKASFVIVIFLKGIFAEKILAGALLVYLHLFLNIPLINLPMSLLPLPLLSFGIYFYIVPRPSCHYDYQLYTREYRETKIHAPRPYSPRINGMRLPSSIQSAGFLQAPVSSIKWHKNFSFTKF